MRQYCHSLKSRIWMKRKKTLESDAMNQINKLCHPADDYEQQQQLQQQYSNTLQSSSSSRKNAWQVNRTTYSYIVQQRTV